MTEGTYEGSRGVAGCDPVKLWAKLTLLPSCLDGFWIPETPIGTAPLKAHPLPLLALVKVSVLFDSRCYFVAYPSCRSANDSTACVRFVEVAVGHQSQRACLALFAALLLTKVSICFGAEVVLNRRISLRRHDRIIGL